MPAVVDDPASPTIYRVSGQPPFPDPGAPLPDSIVPRRVTLRDRQTVATILPIVSVERQVPQSLINYLCGQINREIEGGDTYPMMEPFTPAGFAAYWFQNFGAVMLLGDFGGDDSAGGGGTAIPDSHDWARDCLGSFYIKPNYPGRSSHVCNGGLLVTDASRNRGVGRLMGESYIDWAPRLGYTYSVFNLVYETNVASCRIWDALGFKRIGRVKGCGNLRSHPDRLVDGIIYGRDLPPPRDDGDDGGGEDGALLVSEERFDKIRYYLKFGRYPEGADRAEKSRLRSAATHYKLLDDGDTLMLKDKLVVSDPARQYDIARATHSVHHGGINKTTAVIAEKYHWSRIKETVSDVIRLCRECKELAKAPGSNSNSNNGTATNGGRPVAASKPTTPVAGVKRPRSSSPDATDTGPTSAAVALARSQSGPPGHAPSSPSSPPLTVDDHERVLGLRAHHTNSTLLAPEAVNPLLHHHHHHHHQVPHLGPYANPSDISVVRPSQTTLLLHGAAAATGFLHGHHQHEDDSYQPIDPQIMNHHHHHVEDDQDHAHEDGMHHAFDGYHPHADFQALLHATEDDGGAAAAAAAAAESERRAAAVDRDLEMLIAHGAEDEDEDAMAVAVGGVLEKPAKDGAGADGGAGEEGAATVGVGHVDEDLDDLDDSLLRDTREWG